MYVDGAKNFRSGEREVYITSDECWMGKIDHKDPNKIEWSCQGSQLIPDRGILLLWLGQKHDTTGCFFPGGTTAPHNYKGLEAATASRSRTLSRHICL